MTTQFRCQSTQRNFYKQATLSCCLCSSLPQPPLGSGLACQSTGQVASVQVHRVKLEQGLPPKAPHKTESQGSPSQPTRKGLGSSTNRSQRAKGRAKTRESEPRAQSRSGASWDGGGCSLGSAGPVRLVFVGSRIDGAELGWAGIKGQWQGRHPQPLGILPAQLLFYKPLPQASVPVPGKHCSFLGSMRKATIFPIPRCLLRF